MGGGGLIEAGDPLADRFDVGTPKAMLPIAGKPMVQWVLDAIAASEQLTRVFVSGLSAEHGLHCGRRAIHYLPREERLMETVLAGARAMRAAGATRDRAIWVSGDLPLVRAEMLDWFATEAQSSPHDGYVSVIGGDLMRRRFPSAARTAVRFKDRTVYIGDVYAGDTRVALRPVHPVWAEVAAARKSPLRIAARVGLWSLLRFAAGQMTSARATRLARERFGLDLTLVDCPWAEMAMDVDRPSQFDIVSRELAGRA